MLSPRNIRIWKVKRLCSLTCIVSYHSHTQRACLCLWVIPPPPPPPLYPPGLKGVVSLLKLGLLGMLRLKLTKFQNRPFQWEVRYPPPSPFQNRLVRFHFFSEPFRPFSSFVFGWFGVCGVCGFGGWVLVGWGKNAGSENSTREGTSLTPQAYYEAHEADWFGCVESSLRSTGTAITGGRLKLRRATPLSDVAALRTSMGETMRGHFPSEARVRALLDHARAFVDDSAQNAVGAGGGGGDVVQLSEDVALTMLASEAARRHPSDDDGRYRTLGKLRGHSNLIHAEVVGVQISNTGEPDRRVSSGSESGLGLELGLGLGLGLRLEGQPGMTGNGNIPGMTGNGNMLYLVPPICENDAMGSGSSSRRFQALQLSIVGLCLLLDILQEVGREGGR
jgi:hypothetical protein